MAERADRTTKRKEIGAEIRGDRAMLDGMWREYGMNLVEDLERRLLVARTETAADYILAKIAGAERRLRQK
ncbi:MAG: hypothetical protein O2894_08495 [Planctomycetota bacterium]|nr:hypothetical protein [Planctomycetota bacterium]